MIHASGILVIIGSTRPRRLCPKIARWVAEIGRESVRREIEVVDLKDWALAADGEKEIPHIQDYALEPTRAWSRKIAGAASFVFVAPQYNWGYPAPLKNALDHLYREWHGKPAMIVSYGHRGGNKCAAQLHQVLKGLHMKPVATSLFKLSKERIKANTGEIEPAKEFAKHTGELRRGFAALDAAMNGGRLASWWRTRLSARTSPTG